MKLRPLAAVAAVFSLSVSAVAALPAPSASAADAGPGNAGAAWITDELENGLVVGSYVDTFTDPQNPTVVEYTDYGLSVDIALALDYLDPADPTADAISDALAADIENYVNEAQFGVPVNVGSLAKAAVLAQTVGDSATSYGGRNLIADLAARVTDTGSSPSAGRAVNDGFDYANTLVQAFAVQALDAAGHAEAGAALDYLLLQQCAAGFFRGTLPAADAPDQTCDGGNGSPSIDATALAVVALQDVGGPAVDAAVADAIAWLGTQQQADGSVGAEQNANRTGLAGWAFELTGHADRAADAATWLRRHQVADPGTCDVYAPGLVGAVALDDAGYEALEDGMGLHDETAEVRRATAQALPALKSAPAAGTEKVTAPTGYVAAGTTATIRLSGLAPGDTVCVTRGTQRKQARAGLTGRLSVAVSTGSGTADRTVAAVGTGGSIGQATLKVLGAQRLRVTLERATLPKGASQVVTVSKLAPREKFVIRVAGRVLERGKAGPLGKVRVRFPAAGAPGRVAVKVVGQFPSTRKGAGSFRVTR